jgi:hypothetical protein
MVSDEKAASRVRASKNLINVVKTGDTYLPVHFLIGLVRCTFILAEGNSHGANLFF